MDTDKIIQDLNRRFAAPLPEFYQRRIIFWYDEDKEFEDKLDEVVLENAKVIALTGNNAFSVKKMLSVDDLTTNYLVYSPCVYNRPDDNWLLDVELYSEEFRADLISIWMDEMGLSQLLDANKIPEQIEECKIKKSEVEHKMSIYKEKGVAEKLKKQTGYTTDKAKLDSVKGRIDSAVRELKKCYDNNKDVTLGLQGVESIYNSDIIKKASDILSAIGNEILKIGEAVTQIESTSLEFADVVEMLSKKIDGLSDEFAEIKREIKDDTLDIDGFVKMTEELEKCKENLKQLDERAKSKKQIESAFKKAMRERNDILLEQFNAYKLEIQKINESQNELKITIDFKGDRDNFKSQMKTDFRGSGISEIKYQSLCDTFRDYVELIEDWILCDGMKIKEIISSSEYTKLDKKLQDQYADLLKNQVSNNVEIYYHDKLLRHHSIGQRASALILFILMQSDNDIILIDQPEDDLDNKIIYDEVITAIAKKKQEIQFIFATHNANIPVLGDAERIFVVEYQDTTIDISQGNIDLKSTHKQIVDIMEGGEEAFDKRQLIYTSWK